MGKKIRGGTTSKIPILLVDGEDEMSNNTVTVRRYGTEEQQTINTDAFVDQVLAEIRDRRDVRRGTELVQ
jgi:threonyl-tRNA synthetase